MHNRSINEELDIRGNAFVNASASVEKKCGNKPKRKDAKFKEWKDCRASMPGSERKGIRKIAFLFQATNPLLAAARAGTLLAFRVNLFGMAIKTIAGILPEAELKKKGFDLENAKKSKEAFHKVEKLWIKLGGNPEKLKKVIMSAYTHKATKWEGKGKTAKLSFDEYQNFSDYEEFTNDTENFDEYQNAGGVDDAVIIGAAATVISSVLGFITSSKASKNPYAQGKAPAGFDPNYPDSVPSDFRNNPNAINVDAEMGGLGTGAMIGIGVGVAALIGTIIYAIVKAKKK